MKMACCVIGYPIRHSLSPAIHNALYARYGLDCEYSVREVPPGGLGAFVEGIPAQGMAGFNVTMPYKQAIIPYLANRPAGGSVNTVAVRNGRLTGFSTDEAGFLKSLLEAGYQYQNRSVVFIGSGAVAGSLARDAVRRGAARVVLLGRSLKKARTLAAEIGCAAGVFDAAAACPEIEGCDMLVNATPQGMSGCAPFAGFAFLNGLPKTAPVCDLVYSPRETDLLKEAARRGNPALGGIHMLVWQAFYAFEHFFGILPDGKDKAHILSKIENLV